MDLLCPRIANHANDLPAGRAAHDGVVDQDYALALEQTAHRIQLELHAEIADSLLGFDKSASYIVIANESEAERNAAFCGVSQSGGDAGIWNRDDEVRIHRHFFCQLATQRLAA